MKTKFKFCDNDSYVKELYLIHTNLSDFYFNTEDCFYCYIVESDKPLGFIQFTNNGFVVQILVIIAKNEKVKKELLTAIIGFAKENHLSIEWRIISKVIGSNPINNDFELAESLGFTSTSLLHIYSSDKSIMGKALEYIKHLKSLSDFVLENGFKVCPFSKISENARNYICENPDNEFAGYLDSGKYIKSTSGLFSEDCSFVVFKGEKPVAYSVIRMLSKGKYVFENLCVAKTCRNNGSIVPVIYSSLNAIALSDYNIVIFAIYDENRECLPIAKKHCKDLISQEKLQINYFMQF